MSDLLSPRGRCRQLALLAIGLLALVAAAGTSNAQDRNRRDTRGREFRLAFLPTNGDAPAPTFMFTVWCDRPTVGVVIYEADPSNSFTVAIDQPYRPYTFRLDTNLLMMENPRSAAVSNRSVLLRFDAEVTIYGINTMRWSSDAFTAIPVDALGMRYRILSYPNTQQPNPDRPTASDFPSQFAVLATEDGTRVDITPTARFNGSAGRDPVTVSLNAGQVFLGQADGPTGVDLSGTEIRATRPVVVYGSHQRTNIPYDLSIGRDHLIEQMLPIESWSSRAILTPHFQLPKSAPDEDFARVLAAFDDTQVSVDSMLYGTIQSGARLEIPLVRGRAQLVTANRPILVAQYHNSSIDSRDPMPNDSIGDPFFMLIASREQFDSVYVFQSYDTKDFRLHYVNVVVPTERIGTLRLDGAPTDGQFQRIPKTSYSFAQLAISPGGHTMTASVPFGLYVYGYGPYNSYGYPGGFVLDTLFKDHKEPRIAVYDSCIGGTGKAYDDSSSDFGMERVELLPGSRNVVLNAERPPLGSDSIHFRLDLIDPFFDGYAELKAVDTAGLDASTSVWVKGFTVAIAEGQLEPFTVDTLASLSGLAFCRKIQVVNYGRFDQVIQRITVSPNAASVSIATPLPLFIPAGARADIEVCFQFAGDTSFAVEIGLDNGCIDRPIVLLPLIAGIDSLPPNALTESEPCDPAVTVRLSEPGLLNSGIARLDFLVQENYVPDVNPALPAKSATLTLRRQDPRRDVIYDIVVTDAVGLTRRISDTIGGFTVAAYQPPQRQVAIRLGSAFEYEPVLLGGRQCDSIELVNYGLVPLDLHNPRMLGNIDFSIPPEQLPIRLAPGERTRLAICARPRKTGLQRDTFAVDFVCGGVSETVELGIMVQSFDLASRDECGNPLTFAVNSVAKRTFLEPPAPNPSAGMSTTVTFGLAREERVTLGIFDVHGREVQRLLTDQYFPGGVARIKAGLAGYSAGVYLLRMVTGDGSMLSQKLVVSR